MGLAKFRVVTEAGEPSAVYINGNPLPGELAVLGLSLRVDTVPVLTLVCAGEGVVEGEGIVEIHRESGENYRAELLAFVQGLDAKEIDRLTLAHSDMTTPPGEALKAALVAMLS